VAWWKVDDRLMTNHKVQRLDDASFRLWVGVCTNVAQNLTDGFLPTWATKDLRNGARMGKLVEARLLHAYGEQCECMKGRPWPAEQGWWVHDWLRYNPSKSENTVARAKKAELRSPQLRRAVRDRDGDACRYCGRAVNFSDHRSAAGGVVDHVDPLFATGVDNLVVACKGCNTRKKDRTPAQAGMALRPVPGTPEAARLAAREAAEQAAEDASGPATDPTPTQRGTQHRPESGPGSVSKTDPEHVLGPSRVRDRVPDPPAGPLSSGNGTGLPAEPPDPRRIHDGLTDGSGRGGDGSGTRVGSVGSGPPETPRGRGPDDVNPYVRSGHVLHARDPAFAGVADDEAGPAP